MYRIIIKKIGQMFGQFFFQQSGSKHTMMHSFNHYEGTKQQYIN